MNAIAKLRKICLSFPEAVEKPFGGHTAPCFSVRDKLFVMTAEAGRPRMVLKGRPGAQQALVGSEPDRFFVPPYVGGKGWVGAWLDVAQDWDELAELVEESYRMTAPKRLAAQLDEPRPPAPRAQRPRSKSTGVSGASRRASRS